MSRPNCCIPSAWQSTGSPTSAVADEKFGSLSVHRRSAPAGTTVCCAQTFPSRPRNTNGQIKKRSLRFISRLHVEGQAAGQVAGPERQEHEGGTAVLLSKILIQRLYSFFSWRASCVKHRVVSSICQLSLSVV